MANLDTLRRTISKIAPSTETYPVLVEGETLHFPIHHRHAPVGTVHKWGDGHHYRKTVTGWELVHEPGSGDNPGHPDSEPEKKGAVVTQVPGSEPRKDIEYPGASAAKDVIFGAEPLKRYGNQDPSITHAVVRDDNPTDAHTNTGSEKEAREKAAYLNSYRGNYLSGIKFHVRAYEPVEPKASAAEIAARSKPVAQASKPGSARTEFRDGKHAVINPDGTVRSTHSTAKEANAALNAPMEKPMAALPPAVMAKHPEMFDVMGHHKWEAGVKVGDEVELRWTNSHNYYRARARVVANNDGSLRAALLHGIASPYTKGEDSYSVGREIVVPKSLNLRARGRFGFNQKWSQSNGVFPVGEKTKPADTAKLDAHAAVVKGNGMARDYARGDKIRIHYPHSDEKYSYMKGPIDYTVEKSLYSANRLSVKPIDPKHGYAHSIDLSELPHRIEKLNNVDPKPVHQEIGGVPVKAEPAKPAELHVPRHHGTPEKATHAVVDAGTGITMSHQPSEIEAKTVADTLSQHHGRSYHVATIDPKKSHAHKPATGLTHTTYDSGGFRPVEFYDTKSVKRATADSVRPERDTHAVVDSDTGEVLASFGDMSTGVENAAGGHARGHLYNQYGHPTGRNVHVDTLEPYTAEHKAVHDAAHKKIADKHVADRKEYDASPEGNWIKGPEQLKPEIPEKPAHVSQEMHDAVSAFAHQVSAYHAKNLVQAGYVGKVHVHGHTPKVKYKKTYAYVDVGGSGKYMIPLAKPQGRMSHAEIGDVHGLDSAYGVPHPGKRFGNVLKGTGKPIPHGSV